MSTRRRGAAVTKYLYSSERYFKVWHYTVSHCRLLLRSTKDTPAETRIDVHFGGVRLMLIRPYYDGLRIRTATDDECQRISLDYAIECPPEQVFVLGSDLSSLVVSGPPQWHEDHGTSRHPSWFGDPPGVTS